MSHQPLFSIRALRHASMRAGFSTGDRHPEPVTLAHPTRPARATPDAAHRAAWARRPDLADRVRTRDAREAFQGFFTGAGGGRAAPAGDRTTCAADVVTYVYVSHYDARTPGRQSAAGSVVVSRLSFPSPGGLQVWSYHLGLQSTGNNAA